MTTELRAETRASASARLYRRRRVVFAALVLAASLLVLSGCRAVVTWLAGDAAEPAAAAEPLPGDIEETPAECPEGGTVAGTAEGAVPPDLRSEVDRLLDPRRLGAQEILDPEAVRRLLAEHRPIAGSDAQDSRSTTIVSPCSTSTATQRS